MSIGIAIASRPLVIWILFFTFLSLFADAQPNPCLDIKTMKTVKAPWDPSNPKSSTFNYRFKHEIVNPVYPTVVIIPGGPGQTSIVSPSGQFPMGAIPANFNKVYTDPRSQGCNYSLESGVLAAYLKTEFVVNDIFLAIKSLKLKNYILYGASYGTVVATQLVKKLEAEKFDLPKALVLEGTVGRKADNFDSYFYFFQYEWERVFAQLQPRWKTYFQNGKYETTFGKQEWASLILNDIIVGDIPESPVMGHIFYWHLRLLEKYFAKKITQADLSSLQPVFSKLKPVQFPTLFFRMIGCGELWGDWYYGRSLENGKLIRTGKNVCEGIEYKNHYDANKFPIPAAVPVYYFQGTNDPATPMHTALYHFAVQRKTSRQFITVSGASHAPLTSSLRTCADDIWNAILNQKTLGRELNGCPRQTSLTAKQAGQE